MPPIAPYLGHIVLNGGKKNLSIQHRAVSDLIKQLPGRAFFEQFFHPNIKNCLAYYWNGFKLQTRYTYGLDDISNIGDIFQKMQGRARGAIRKAEKSVSVSQEKNSDILYELLNKTFNKRNKKSPFGRGQLKNLTNSCFDRNCGKLYVAKNKRGNPLAAAFVVWDGGTAYDLLQASDPGHLGTNAISLTVWRAIEDASGNGISSFDFTGSMMKGVESFLRSFGANQKTYIHVTKEFSPFYSFLQSAKIFRDNYFRNAENNPT